MLSSSMSTLCAGLFCSSAVKHSLAFCRDGRKDLALSRSSLLLERWISGLRTWLTSMNFSSANAHKATVTELHWCSQMLRADGCSARS